MVTCHLAMAPRSRAEKSPSSPALPTETSTWAARWLTGGWGAGRRPPPCPEQGYLWRRGSSGPAAGSSPRPAASLKQHHPSATPHCASPLAPTHSPWSSPKREVRMAPVPEASICCSGVMPPPGLGDVFSAMALAPCNTWRGDAQGLGCSWGGPCPGMSDGSPRSSPPPPPQHPHSISVSTGVPPPALLSAWHRAGTAPPVIMLSWGGGDRDRSWGRLTPITPPPGPTAGSRPRLAGEVGMVQDSLPCSWGGRIIPALHLEN